MNNFKKYSLSNYFWF